MCRRLIFGIQIDYFGHQKISLVELVVPCPMNNHCTLGVHPMKGDLPVLVVSKKAAFSAALFSRGCPGQARA